MSKYIAPSIALQSFNCPHCGALAAQEWYKTFVTSEENNQPHIFYPAQFENISKKNLEEKKEIPEDIIEYFKKLSEGRMFFKKRGPSEYVDLKAENVFFSKCYSCDDICVWLFDKLLYPPEPEAEEANPDMPQDIKQDFQEARLVFKHSPKAAAALLRLCVEKLCIELKAEGKSLNDRIGDLVKKGLNKRLQQALDSVRVIGNESVHPGQIDLNDNKDIARALFKLVNQIVQELISDLKEIDEIYDLLPESKKKGIEARDKKTASQKT